MALDIPALPSANQVLRYAKASYDFTRDGGDTGIHIIPSQQVPAGATLLRPTLVVQTPCTADATAAINIKVGTQTLYNTSTDDLTVSAGGPSAVGGTALADGSLPITVEIADNHLTAGAFTIYVWYVL